MASQPKIVIVGGGIGGLFAANALIAQGLHVAVYEQAPVLGESNAVSGLASMQALELATEAVKKRVDDLWRSLGL